jgi:hypothetical protein
MAHMLHRLRRLSHKMCGAPNLIRFRSDNVVPTQRAVASERWDGDCASRSRHVLSLRSIAGSRKTHSPDRTVAATGGALR